MLGGSQGQIFMGIGNMYGYSEWVWSWCFQKLQKVDALKKKVSNQPSGTKCSIRGMSKPDYRDSAGCIWFQKLQCLTGCCRQANIMVSIWIFKIDCLRYFSVAEKRHYDQANLQKTEFIGADSFRGWVHDQVGRAAPDQSGMALEQ